MNIPSLFNCRSVRSASINHVNSHAPGSALMSQLQPFPPPPPPRFRQNVPVGLQKRDMNPPPTHPSGSQMYTPQNPPPCIHRSQTQSMNALGSPFRTPPSRPASTRVYPRILQPQFQLRSANTQACQNGVTPPIYVPSIEPHSSTSALTSTISRINDNCQSTLVRIRADIEALHVHYQHIIRRERAEAVRARAIARTMEAERDTARESVAKITEDQRKLTNEHLALKCLVAETNSRDGEEKEKDGQGTGTKRKRARLTAEALLRLEVVEAAAIEGGTRDDSTDSSRTFGVDDGAECADEKPPRKKFRLQKRVWTPSRGGEGALTNTSDIKNLDHD